MKIYLCILFLIEQYILLKISKKRLLLNKLLLLSGNDLLNISMEAEGTTMEKNSRNMDSLAAHMEKLGASGERVKSAMIDSDSFKGLIDVGTGLTNLFANLIESIWRRRKCSFNIRSSINFYF